MYENFEYDKKLVECVPSERQMKVQQMEFYAFVHFTVNTFTNKEWGDGTESESVFAPTKLDAMQWAQTFKAAGMQGMILTAKHHDGFCLWPSAYTEHSVKNSPFGKTGRDIVKEAAEACRKTGLKFGVYLSPWDRNSVHYGKGKEYDDYFCSQLTELLTNYGDIFSVWFDGACGEGKNGKKQVYDWDRYYALVRKLQPDACISICGPDIRWCGNEAGNTRPSEWSVLPTGFDSNDEVAENSQHDENAPVKNLDATNEDLGSREFLRGASGLAWKPAEVDTSIRPGWFWHKSENGKVRSLKKLFDIYTRTVGGNCTLLLNIPADNEGLINAADVKRLEALGSKIREIYGNNLFADAVFTSDKDDGVHTADALASDYYETWFACKEGENTAQITVKMPEKRKIRVIEIKENILKSQRIESFAIDCLTSAGWKTVYSGTTVGYKKYACFRCVNTDTVRIRIPDSRVCPCVSYIAAH